MEEATGAESLLSRVKPPRLEDAGLEDCALPPESIHEAFLKAASAVRSLVSASDSEDESKRRCCVDDPWEDGSDALVGAGEGVAAPSEGCAAKKGGGLTEAPADEVSVGGDGPESKPACVDGLQGLEIGGKKSDGEAEAAEDDAEGEKEKKPILVEGYV